ncbi:hypothetical protein BJ742DRAFT_779912 [Cladochytrium replicatum]|nr:hypothetical protein BJ742DRAFT_779912 [Cladochytrium replicatum]
MDSGAKTDTLKSLTGIWRSDQIMEQWCNGRCKRERAHDVLDWWVISGLKLKWTGFDKKQCDKVRPRRCPRMVKNSGLKLVLSDNVIEEAIRNGQVDALKWWKESVFDVQWGKFTTEHAST